MHRIGRFCAVSDPKNRTSGLDETGPSRQSPPRSTITRARSVGIVGEPIRSGPLAT